MALSTRIASPSEITGPIVVPSVERVARPDLLDERGQPLDERAVHLVRHQDALHRDAHLARVDVAARGGRGGDRVEIGVGKHDQRAVRTELEREALHTGDARDLLSHGGRAREADLADPRVGAQDAPEFGARPREALERVLGKPGLEELSREPEAGQRSVARRLEDRPRSPPPGRGRSCGPSGGPDS